MLPLTHHFTSETLVRDGEVVRWDWQGRPRFYLVRIYPCEPRKNRKRVGVKVYLEGGHPMDMALNYCDDEPDAINEITLGCIGEIESLCGNQWEAEAVAYLDDVQRSEARWYR